MRDWDSWDIESADPLANPILPPDLDAWQREIEWRIPLSFFAIVIVWYALETAVRLLWSRGRARVGKIFQARAASAADRVVSTHAAGK